LPVLAVPPRRSGPDLDSTQRIERVGDSHPSMPPYPSGMATADATTAPTHGRPGHRDTQHRGTQYTAIQRRDSQPVRGQPEPGRRRRPLTKRQRARRRTAFWLLLILLLGLFTGWGAWYLTVGRYHQVPNLAGESRAAAVSELRRDGFTVSSTVAQDFSETVAVGLVLRSDPSAGTHLLAGKRVQLVLSKGAERFTVPQVAGKPYAAAQQAFAGIPVQLNRKDVADDTGKVASGSVIRTDPAADAEVKRNQAITVYVSTGPPIVSVPGVTGQTQADATDTLQQAAFKVTTSQDFSNSVPAGQVIGQDPAADARVPKFSTVHLVISEGPPLVTLPQIPNGTSVGDARNTLQALHLKVRIKKVFGGFLGKVVGMSPGAGKQVPVGSEVTLTVV
ncbi:MAG TPA: PASTA domain-containing protein, partial [Jatrophihabitans sp.]|nr:PASTA domain-containing protein [Jatrophihabitans sp.]